MSHQATNWAMKQRDMKPATKTVLLCLADRHNPENGCFPSHKRIATDACMSERSVRNHLAELEAMGLLRRVKGTGGRLKRAATRYVFAFEDGFEAVDNSAECAESRRQKCAESRRQILPPNTVREPLKEEDAREAPDSNDLFEGVKRAVGFGPNAILPSWWRERAARDHVIGWKERFGLTEAEILDVAAATRKDQRETKKRQTTARLPRPLLAHLRRWAGAGSRHVVSEGGARIGDIKTAWRRACREAGLADVTPHTLRHTAITWAMQNGAQKWDVAGYFGVSMETLERTYGHHHPDYQATAVEAMERRR